MWVTKRIIDDKEEIIIEYLNRNEFSFILTQNYFAIEFIQQSEMDVYSVSFNLKEQIIVNFNIKI